MKTFQQFLEQKNICNKCKMRPAGDNEGFEDVPANTWCNKCL